MNIETFARYRHLLKCGYKLGKYDTILGNYSKNRIIYYFRNEDLKLEKDLSTVPNTLEESADSSNIFTHLEQLILASFDKPLPNVFFCDNIYAKCT